MFAPKLNHEVVIARRAEMLAHDGPGGAFGHHLAARHASGRRLQEARERSASINPTRLAVNARVAAMPARGSAPQRRGSGQSLEQVSALHRRPLVE
jgi:hypothetical protein